MPIKVWPLPTASCSSAHSNKAAYHFFEFCVVAAEDFDDEELLELAQAGRSQQDQVDDYHINQRPDHTESGPSGSKSAEDHITAAQPSTSEQLEPYRTQKQQAAPIAASGNDYVELDDDELLEMACAGMDPQQDSPTALLQPPPSLTKASSHDAHGANADSRNEAQGETCQDVTVGLQATKF